LSLKAARLDAIAKLKSLIGASNLSCRHTQCRFIYIRRRARLMPLTACAMDWRRNRILKVGKNCGPILNNLWTKVYEILGQCRVPLVLFDFLARLSVSCFIKKICAIKSESHRKAEQMSTFFWPRYLGGTTFLRQI